MTVRLAMMCILYITKRKNNKIISVIIRKEVSHIIENVFLYYFKLFMFACIMSVTKD